MLALDNRTRNQMASVILIDVLDSLNKANLTRDEYAAKFEKDMKERTGYVIKLDDLEDLINV